MNIKLFLLLFFVWTGKLYSQTDLKYDSINFEEEKGLISDFILNFSLIDNSSIMQNDVEFTNFYFYPKNTSISPIPLLKRSNMSNSEIRILAKEYTPADQVYYLKLKYFYDPRFKNKLDRKNILLSDYIFKDSLNRLTMCEYIINTCKFPLKIEEPIRFIKIENRIDLKKETCSVVEYNLGLYTIGITKLNHEYKVISIITNQIIN